MSSVVIKVDTKGTLPSEHVQGRALGTWATG